MRFACFFYAPQARTDLLLDILCFIFSDLFSVDGIIKVKIVLL